MLKEIFFSEACETIVDDINLMALRKENKVLEKLESRRKWEQGASCAKSIMV